MDSLIDLLEYSFRKDLCLVFVFEMTVICGVLKKQVFTYIIVDVILKFDFHFIFFST
jgi:hypothetical protein